MRRKNNGTVSKKKIIKDHELYLGLPWDSFDELNFLYWCEELIEAGYIKKVERAKSYLLTSGITNTYSYVQQLKTKSKPVTKNQTILQGSSYNPDFEVTFTPLGVEKFCWQIGDNCKCDKLFINDLHFNLDNKTTVEIKPDFDFNNMERLFRNNQKFLYEKYLVYTNLIIPSKLFQATFYPAKALLTNKTKQKKKINFVTKSLKEYLAI